jgi:ribonuclease Z
MGADLLIHECFQSPAVYAKATGLPLETALDITRLAHTVPEQLGRILALTQPRMSALWHLDLTPGVDTVFDELAGNYHGPVTVTQDFTVFNVTEAAVIARQTKVSTPRHPCTAPRGPAPGWTAAGARGMVGRRAARRLAHVRWSVARTCPGTGA